MPLGFVAPAMGPRQHSVREGDLPHAIVSRERQDEGGTGGWHPGSRIADSSAAGAHEWHDACFAFWQAMTAQLDN